MADTGTATPTTETETSRLFWHLVPGLLLAVLLVGVGLIGRQKAIPPHEELRQILDQPNPILRRQGLGGFQNRLRTEIAVAADPDVARELLTRLDRLLAVSTPREEAYQQKRSGLSPEKAELERKLLLGDRDHLQELLATLPGSLVPVGLPLLGELAEATPALDPEALTARRQGALQALGVLGESAQRAKQIIPEDLDALIRDLGQAPASGRVREGLTAAASYLQGVRQGQPDLDGLEKSLGRCAGDADPAVREGTAFAARWWEGTATQNAEIDRILLQLSEDDGRNDRAPPPPIGPDGNPAPALFPRPIHPQPGFRTRAQAILALAYRGSSRLPLERLNQLLDPDYLNTMLRVEVAEGKSEPNQPAVLDLLQAALRAVVRLHEKAPARDLSLLQPALKKLAESPQGVIRLPAEQTLKNLAEKPNS